MQLNSKRARRMAANVLERNIGLAIRSIAEDPHSLYHVGGTDQDRVVIAEQMAKIAGPFLKRLYKLGAFNTCDGKGASIPLPDDYDLFS